mgnify:CR=1 FL=1
MRESFGLPAKRVRRDGTQSAKQKRTLIRKDSAASSRVLRLSSRGPLRIAPSLASSSVTAGIQLSSTSVSTIIRTREGEMTMELRRGWRDRSTAWKSLAGSAGVS